MAIEITRENDKQLTSAELAARVQVTLQTIKSWRSTYHQNRQGPPFIRIGSGPRADVRYLLTDVIAWEESMRCPTPNVTTVEAEYERQKAS